MLAILTSNPSNDPWQMLWPLRFLQASISSVLLGLVLWAVLRAAARRWPVLASQRAVWLAAQLTTTTIFALTLAPQSARLGILPALSIAPAPPAPTPKQAAAAIESMTTAPTRPLSADATTATTHALTAMTAPVSEAPVVPPAMRAGVRLDAASFDAPQTLPSPTQPVPKGSAWIACLPVLWMLAYGAGLAYAVLRLLRARRLWRGLAALSTELAPADLRNHSAFTAQQLAQITTQKLAVLETEAAISPMLIGAWQPRLLLPRHLRHFGAAQQQLIIEHELTHLRRRDPLQLALTCVLRTLFWFNPALHWFDRQLVWAQELSCDQLVLAGRPQHQRQNYAAALLRQLSAQATAPTAGMPAGGVAFGGIDGSSVAARVRQMRQTEMPSLTRAASCMLAVSMAALTAAAALLQPAFAVTAPAPTFAPPAAAAQASGMTLAPTVAETWRYPLDHVRITGFYAVERTGFPIHHGIDFAATQGMPVHAVASGTVIAAGPFAEHEGRYGTVVLLEHRGQPRSLYSHLGSTAVKVGDTVRAGQLIGYVGATGIATGPHLHFEARNGDQQIDPQLMLAGLDQLATPHALRVRQQQLGH